MFNEYFPQQGYEVEYVTHLWGNPSVTYWANPEDGVIKNQVKVTVEVNSVKPSDYKAVIFIGAYAMDRLRYQEHVTKGQANQAPAVNFLRAALKTKGLKIGTICHSLWLFSRTHRSSRAARSLAPTTSSAMSRTLAVRSSTTREKNRSRRS